MTMVAVEKLEADSYQRRVLSMHVSDSGNRHYRELHLECGHIRLQTAFKLITRPDYDLCPQCRAEDANANDRTPPSLQERLIANYYRTGGPLMAAVRAVMDAQDQ